MAHRAAVDQIACDLLDEQRVAFGLVDNQPRQGLRQLVDAETNLRDPQRLRRGQRGEPQFGDAGSGRQADGIPAVAYAE